MAQYVYESMDRSGAPAEGVIEAESLSAAAQTIRGRGHVVVSIRESVATQAEPGKKGLWLRSVKLRDVAEFCRRLATMIRAGVGVVEALDTISQVQAKGYFQRTIKQMAVRIRSGFSLSETMEEHPEVFPLIAPGMVGAAEASGELPDILVRLAGHIEKRLQVRENILMALLYPCIVFLLTLAVVVVMLTYVFPKISVFLQSHQKTMPPMAQTLLDISAFAATNGVYLAGGFAALILILILVAKTRSGRLTLHRLMLGLPIVGKVFRAASTQLWTRTLGDLLRSGLSLQESLRVTAQVMPNQHMSGLIARTRDRIIGGAGFGESLQKISPLFDNLVCKMVVVGENSGTLEESLDEVSLFAEGDLNRRVVVLSKIFEPAVIVVVGLMVGIVFITCFQAIYAYL
ncbi:MAG: type II secretion system F family protein [Planctomycetes bacterium]|nr:type II secretion system F family protein [Planctomycetota bacterium]